MILSASSLQADLAWNNKPHGSISIYAQDFLNQSNSVKALENRIKSSRCYTSMLLAEILISVLVLVGYGFLRVSIAQLALAGIAGVFMLPGCILGLIAKSKISIKLQRITIVLIGLGTLLSIVSIIIYLVAIRDYTEALSNFDDQLYNDLVHDNVKIIVVVAIILIPVQLVFGLGLILGARIMKRLMEEREDSLEELSVKRSASIVAVL